MTRRKRQIALCLIGTAAALITWPVLELAVHLQTAFPAYLGFSMFLGAVFGIVAGAVFGTAEGITLGISSRLKSGIITGALIGTLGGAAGCLTGQAILFLIGDAVLHSGSAQMIGLPLARAAGWMILGGAIGSIEGIRSRSRLKIRSGLLGGLAGGFIGGLMIEYSRLLIDYLPLARLTGLLCFGFLTGLFYGLAERRLSAGTLRCLNGPLKGFELVLNQRRIRIGTAGNSDIRLQGYHDVEKEHALLLIREAKYGKELSIRSRTPGNFITVNDVPAAVQPVRPDDVIRIGEARFQYRLA